MKVAVLTSSRADFGIYLPLLKAIKADSSFDLEIIAFGTHLSYFHGYTVNSIIEEGFEVKHKIESLVLGDTEESISSSVGLTILKFSSFWANNQDYDIVFCLGDRYEMFAAVTAGIPFHIPFAHLHAGETSLGAIDNVLRHSITHCSRIQFTSTEAYATRVKEMLGTSGYVFHVGALSLENLDNIRLLTVEEFYQLWSIDLRKPTILITFHPETVDPTVNKRYALELCKAITYLNKYQIVITMPNADTNGNMIRNVYQSELSKNTNVHLVENFGTRGYFSLMDRCSFMIGNTSSGIIEAATFRKYVINVGDRQKGRLTSSNVCHAPVSASVILKTVETIEALPEWNGDNIYWNGPPSTKILDVIKTFLK